MVQYIIMVCVVILLICTYSRTSHAQKAGAGLFFKDESFAFEYIRTLGASVWQGADIGECLVVANAINEPNFDSWYKEWLAMAEKIQCDAQKSETQGHFESAKMAYLRASNYYRTADFYLHGNPHDPRIYDVSRKSRECFAKVVQFSQPAIEMVKISYENTFLPGYFYRPVAAKSQQLPTLIIQTGYDGTQEELYGYAQEGVKRGYNVLTFEGPGQGSVIREQKIPFRSDWEKVVTPVIDYLSTRSDVDKDIIMLYGLSYGGYLAPRAAAFDKRIKILMVNGGIYDSVAGILKHFKRIIKTREGLIAFVANHPRIYTSICYLLMRFKTSTRWANEHGMYAFKVQTPAELILKLSEWSLRDYAPNITCPTLVCDSDNELYEIEGQSKMLYDKLTCQKTLLTFTTEDGAGYHMQMGAFLKSNQLVFDWIDARIEELSREKNGY